MSSSPFAQRGSRKDVEEGDRLCPKFDENGLLPAAATDAKTGELLMLAYMNEQALAKTIETGEAHYWSRSRQELWHKGATSGHVQKIVDLRIDCDQDAVWMEVEVGGSGASCHTGYNSCFFRAIPTGLTPSPALRLEAREINKKFDPKKVYGK